MQPTRSPIVVADRPLRVRRRVTLPLWPAAAVLVSVCTLPLLVGLGAHLRGRAEVAELRAANRLLQIENTSYRAATGELTEQISSLHAAVEALGARAAIDPSADRAMQHLPEQLRDRAMGGAAAQAVPLLSAATSPDSPFGVLRDLLGLLEQRLETVRTGVEKRHALASATPSIWPIAGWISSTFGSRRDPFTGGPDFHSGLDISGDHGDPVIAPADGVVSAAAVNGNYGNLVTIDHGFGIVTRYAHLSRYGVVEGQAVSRGQVVGYVGSTGRSTSPHLHYELLVNGRVTNPLKLLGSVHPRR